MNNTIKIKINTTIDKESWNNYASKHPLSNLYHKYEWKEVVERAYGHQAYYLAALKESGKVSQSSIIGVLPLVHIKSVLFGNTLTSIPYFDIGGVLSDNEKAEKCLLHAAIELGQRLKASIVELRHNYPLSSLQKEKNLNYLTRRDKVRMLLSLPKSSDSLLKSFKAKLRSQIKKPLKEGLSAKIGGVELLDDFYHVFLINMRDLGSPVHSKKLLRETLLSFANDGRVIAVYDKDAPVAASIVIGCKDTLQNPWASALRSYSRKAPNMLLYWTMLEYACNQNYKFFDFGRSTIGEGTFNFKKQWGALPQDLYWYSFYSKFTTSYSKKDVKKEKYGFAVRSWKRLSIPITKVIGPTIRKNIPL
jgi:serine/alanine adding enzyme